VTAMTATVTIVTAMQPCYVSTRPEGPRPNCLNELAAVYAAQPNGSTPGCSFLHFNKGASVFPNPTSSICNDVNPAQQGIPSVVYWQASPTKITYFTSGTGSFVWQIPTYTGKEVMFAKIPSGCSPIIGLVLDLQSSLLLLVTIAETYTAPLVASGAVFTKVFDITPDIPNMDVTSRVTNDLTAPKTLYFTSFAAFANSVTSYTWAPNVAPIVNLIPTTLPSLPSQLFWSTQRKGLIAATSNDQLFGVAISQTPGAVSRINATLPVGSTHAAIYADTYYSGNSKAVTAVSVSTGKQLWTACIKNGQFVVGNFVFLA